MHKHDWPGWITPLILASRQFLAIKAEQIKHLRSTYMRISTSSPCQSVSVLQASQEPVISLIVKAECTSAGTGQDQTAAAVTHQWTLSSHGPKRNTVSAWVFTCEPGGCGTSVDM